MVQRADRERRRRSDVCGYFRNDPGCGGTVGQGSTAGNRTFVHDGSYDAEPAVVDHVEKSSEAKAAVCICHDLHIRNYFHRIFF